MGSFTGSIKKPNYNIDYFPQHPQMSFEVIDAQTKEPVGYNERGQVMFHRLMPDVLLFNKSERDIATKISAKEHEDVLQDIYKGYSIEGSCGCKER